MLIIEKFANSDRDVSRRLERSLATP